MKWFLELFPAYRAMQIEVAQATDRTMRAESACAWFQSRCDQLQDELRSVNERSLDDARKVADFSARRGFGESIYEQVAADAPAHQPAQAQTAKSFQMARDLTRFINDETMRKAMERAEMEMGITDASVS